MHVKKVSRCAYASHFGPEKLDTTTKMEVVICILDLLGKEPVLQTDLPDWINT